jgi:hypothetical protein
MKRPARLLFGLAALALTPLAAMAEPKAVVELFTSQGCSSCKPADAYFAELAERGDVIALTLHVDYWDYLGWRDTFGRPENTERQRQYAKALGTRRIYTPQAIVNGMEQVVGSDRSAVDTAIAGSSLAVPVSISRKRGALKIEVGARPLPGSNPTTIRLILYASNATVGITHGENAGSTIEYRNVVRAIRPIGMWDGSPVKITLPEAELTEDGVDGCAVIVQEDHGNGPGAILGAAHIEPLRR